MKFGKKNTEKSDTIPGTMESVEIILRYRDKGINLSQSQKDRLIELNYSVERPDFEGKAHKACNEMLKTPYAQEVINQGYFLELTRHLYNMAISQAVQNKSIYLTIPDPIPSAWSRLSGEPAGNISDSLNF